MKTWSHEIGVVMPTHPSRTAKFMTQRAVQSALDQQYPASGIFVYNDLDHRGAPYSRQRALEANTCEWTAFLDSDDYFLPHHLRTLVNAQVESGADYVYSWYILEHLGVRLGDKDPVFPPGHRFDPWDPENPRQTTITMLVRTELAQSIGFWAPSDEETFPDGNRVGEDYHFTLECNRLGKIYHIPDQTWVWSHHGANTSGRGNQGDAG